MEIFVRIDVAFDDLGHGEPAIRPIPQERMDHHASFAAEAAARAAVQDEVGEGRDGHRTFDCSRGRRSSPTSRYWKAVAGRCDGLAG